MKKVHVVLLAIFFSLMVLPLSVLAAQGDVDASFGTEGIVITDFNAALDSLSSVAIQADGKILAAGSSLNTDDDFAVVRYSSTGTLDTSFGTNGKVIYNSGSTDFSRGLAIHSGKIIVVGQSLNAGSNDFAIARYNSTGVLDTSFDNDGIVTTDFGALSDDDPQAVAIQGDKIVVAGVTNSNGDTDFAVARYNSTGILDSSFGVDGILITDINNFSGDSAHDLFILNGKILVAGSSAGDFAIARYNSAGGLDTSFDNDGIVTTDFGDLSDDDLQAVAIQGDKIVVAGTSNVAGDNDFAIARYNSTGVLDTSFGVDGLVTSDFGGDDQSFDLVIQKDGKIVLAGYSDNSGARDFVVARYNTSGILDTSFGTEGKLIYDINASTDEFRSLGLSDDGRIIAAGTTNSDGTSDFALARIAAYDYATRPLKIFVPTGTNTSGKIQVSWFDSATPGVDYVLESSYSTDDGDTLGVEDAADTWSPWGEIGQTTAAYANLSDLLGGLHRFRVKAVKRLSAPYYHDSAYVESVSVPVSLQVAAPYGIYLPPGPNTTGSIQVSWTESTTPGVLYSLQESYSVDGLPESFTPFSDVIQDTSLSYANITGLVDGFYIYRVYAHKSGYLDSSYTATGTETEGLFEVALGTQAEAPRKFFSSIAGNGSVDLSWSKSRTKPATYVLEQSDDGVNNWAAVASYTDDTLTFANVPGLTNGDYRFQVKTQSGGLNDSNWLESETITISISNTAVAPSVIYLPPSPNLTGNFQVSWSASATPGAIYVLDQSDDGGNNWAPVASYSDNTLRHAYVSGLSYGDYSYRVKTQSTEGFAESGWTVSGTIAVRPSVRNWNVDPTFGSGGNVLTDFSGSTDIAHQIAILPDGKFVVSGFVTNADEDFGVAQYNSSGILDDTFGTGGLVTTDFGKKEESYGMVIQSDGKIIVVGTTYNSPGLDGDYAIARYDDFGNLDTTFNSTGLVTSDFGANDAAYDAAIQTDGKIIVVGSPSIARYNSTGLLDSSFDGDGLGEELAGFGAAYAVAIQPDGKIVIAGTNGTSEGFVVARYNPTGVVDSSFGTNGVVITDFGVVNARIMDIVIQHDGKIIAVGSNGNDFTVARYSSTGILDNTFDGDGLVTIDLGGSREYAESVTLQDDGKIVVGGFDELIPDFVVMRLNADGSLDTTFNNNGIFVYDFNSSFDGLEALAIEPAVELTDSKIVAAGFSDTNGSFDFALVRFEPEVAENLLVETPRKIFVSKPKNGHAQVSWFESGTPDVTFVLEESADGGNIWSVVTEYTESTLAYVDVTRSGATIFRVKAVKAGYKDSTWTESKSVFF